jgi:hypothetical protein
VGDCKQAPCGTVKEYQIARKNKISPWIGEATERHHSDPKFMGGDSKQDLTPMSKSRHKQLHNDMDSYLREQQDMNGNHMRPQKGNYGPRIQSIFNRQQRIDALKGFYNKYPLKYWDAKLDFYRNNKMIRQWRLW